MKRTYFILNPDEIAAFRFQASGERRQEHALNLREGGNTKSHTLGFLALELKKLG